MRGRLPTPANLSAVRGNPSHRARPAMTPALDATPTKTNIAPPKALDRGARRVWKRLIAPAIQDGRIDPILDRGVAMLFCSAEAERVALDAIVRTSPNAGIAIYPATSRAMRCRDRAAAGMLRCAEALGLTPVSRLRLTGRGGTARPVTAEGIRARLRA